MEQAQQATPQEQQIVVGFENALNSIVPNWHDVDPKVIDMYRAFYNQGVVDLGVFTSVALGNLNQAIANVQTGYQFLTDSAKQGGVHRPPAEKPKKNKWKVSVAKESTKAKEPCAIKKAEQLKTATKKAVKPVAKTGAKASAKAPRKGR